MKIGTPNRTPIRVSRNFIPRNMWHFQIPRAALFLAVLCTFLLGAFLNLEKFVAFPLLSRKVQIQTLTQKNFTFVADLIKSTSVKLGLDHLSVADLNYARSLYQKVRPTLRKPCSTYQSKTLTDNNIRILQNSQKLKDIEVQRLQRKTYLQKTVFESRPKVILFVGLEGTGHHFVHIGFRTLFTDKNYSSVFGGYTNMVKCKTHWKVFDKNESVHSFKQALKNFQSKVLFLNSVSGKFSFFLGQDLGIKF